jgi:hypothetical protein
MDDSVTPAPSQRDNGGFSVPHSSPGEGGEGSSMSLDIVGVMEHGAETGTMAVECSLPSAPVVATTTASAEYQLSYTEAEEDDATDGRMRLASDSHIQVDLSALVADTDTDTDTGGAGGYPLNAHNDNGGNLGGVGGDLCGGDEVREAEGAEPVAVHPPAQGKPSFAFSRKGLAGQA